MATSDVTVASDVYLRMSPIQNEGAIMYVVCRLNKSLLIDHSTDCHSVHCITLDCVHCARKGSAKELTSLRCPKMYSVWVNGNITVPTNESELV